MVRGEHRPAGEIIRLVNYDADWPRRFRLERLLLREALRHLPAGIEHIGSTAVPGMPAKPIVDIMVGFPEIQNPAPYLPALTAAGYLHRGENGLPGRQFFVQGKPRSHHLHLVVEGGPFWVEHLRFRNLLRSNTEVAAEYATLKHSLAEASAADRRAYTEGKTSFVRRVLGSCSVPVQR